MPSEGQYNSLPADFEEEQKRRTEFASPQEKLDYDAEGLIALARKTYRRYLVTVAEALELRSRKNPESGADEDVEGLRQAIAVKLKSQPACEAFIDQLALSEEAREKLKNMMTPEEYGSAVKTYYEMGGTRVPPTRDQIAAELMTWSLERLRDECDMREKPTILIVPGFSFDKGIEEMNIHKHYENAGGGQNDAYVYSESDSPYVDAPKPKKGRVTITDGVVHPKQLTGVSTKLGERRNHLTQKFAEKRGMRHIDGVEMETLFQKSLLEAKAAGNNDLIVDNWESGDGTATFVNPQSLTKSELVACAVFDSAGRRVSFNADFPDHEYVILRGRASVQVMEF